MSIWKGERCDCGAFGAGGGTACMPRAAAGLHGVCGTSTRCCAIYGPWCRAPSSRFVHLQPEGWMLEPCLLFNS